MLGTQVGGYRILSKLGEGGMGAVYLAEHALMGRKTAVKTLLPEYSQNADIVQRFFNEAKAASAVRHPGIVEIYDFGFRDDGTAYIAMEFLEGESLTRRLRTRGRLSMNEAAGIIQQMAAALGAAHKAGIVHRDLKPDNVFIVPDPEIGERVKILDFGIAKLVGEGPQQAQKTRTGMIMGTPSYMSPEQCRGAGQVDHRTDFYALGCMYFELLCGRPPFVGDGAGAVLGAHIYEPPPPPSALEPSIPPELDAFILRLLAKDRDERPGSHIELLGAMPGGRAPTHPGVMPAVSAVMDISATPTTLSGSAAEVTGDAPRSRPAIVLGAAGALIAAGVLMFVLMGRGSDGGEPMAAPAAAGATAESASAEGSPSDLPAPAEEMAEKAAKQVVKEAAEAADLVPTEPARVRIAIDSEPADAEVIRKSDGERVGRTPWSAEVEPGEGELVFVVRKSGYADSEVVVPAGHGGDERVVLARRSRSGKSSASKSDKLRPGKKTRKPGDLDVGPDIESGDAVDPF